MNTTSEHESPVRTTSHHASHLRLFVAVFVGLLGLTLVSFAIANSPVMETPAIAWSAMIAVSCAKAFLVIAFFMHLRWEANWKFVLTIPATVMSLLIVLILIPDIMYRDADYNHVRRTYSADPYTASYANSEDSNPGDADAKPNAGPSDNER